MQRKLLFIAIIVIAIVCLLLSFMRVSSFGEYEAYADFAPTYGIEKYPRPTLMQTTTDIHSILLQRKKLKTNHISGLIICSLPSNWYDIEASLNATYKDCQKLNRTFPENYLMTRLVPQTLEQMPNWDDIGAWVTINQRIQTIAQFAKHTGFKGLLIDTTVNGPEFWCPAENPRYKDISDEFASKVIYQRSREMIQSISKVSSTIPILLAPTGLIATQPKYSPYPNYQYWIHFANGLLSTRHPGGITFVADNYININNTQNMQDQITSDLATINSALDERAYWLDKGALSILLEKSSTENNYVQLRLAQKYSQKYVIISDTIAPELIAQLYDPRLKSYYEYVLTQKKSSWIKYYWRSIIHSIKDNWHEII